MNIFLKSTAAIIIALIFYLVLLKQGKDISSLLTIFVCCIIGIAAFEYLTPVIDFINSLSELGGFDQQMLDIILRCVGIGMIAEITSTICTDAGNTALSKILQLLATMVVLWLSLPILEDMVELIKEILKEV